MLVHGLRLFCSRFKVVAGPFLASTWLPGAVEAKVLRGTVEGGWMTVYASPLSKQRSSTLGRQGVGLWMQSNIVRDSRLPFDLLWAP
jgi:hypothetical protein